MFPKVFLISSLLLLPGIVNAMPADSTAYTQPKFAPVPFAVKTASALAINGALTYSIKSAVNETRPDGIGHDSWPSGHAAWAFTGAGIAARELGMRSGWWAVGAHALADGVIMQRTFAKKHFPKDVLGGAMFGIVSSQLGYLIGDFCYPGTSPRAEYVDADWLPGVDVVTTAIFPVRGGSDSYTAHTSVASWARITLPMSDNWGMCAGVTAQSVPLYSHSTYVSTLNGIGISAGIAAHTLLPWHRWSLEARLMPGVMKNLGAKGIRYSAASFTTDFTVGADCRLTHNFNVGAEAGYSYRTLHSDIHAITAGFYTRATF